MPKDGGAEQGDVDGPVECSLALEMVAAETRGSIAARQAAGTLRWIGVNDPAEGRRLQTETPARMQKSANFQLGVPEKLTGAHDPEHALLEGGGLADKWYKDDGDIMCHPMLVPSFLQEFDVANARVGAERNPLKTEVIFYVNDLEAAPPEWRVGDVRSLAKTSAVTDGSIRSRCWVSAVHHGPAPEQGRCHPSNARTRRSSPSERLSGRQPYQPHPAGSRPHNTILEEQRAAEVYDEIGQRSVERLFPGLIEDSMTQATLSAGQSGIGYKERQTLLHTWELSSLPNRASRP